MPEASLKNLLCIPILFLCQPSDISFDTATGILVTGNQQQNKVYIIGITIISIPQFSDICLHHRPVQQSDHPHQKTCDYEKRGLLYK